MKSYFKIILITLISCCYLNTVFEFSDTERRANFENETHNYIQQDTQTISNTYSKITLQPDKVIVYKQTRTFNPFIVYINDTSNYKTDYFLPPPEHRYIYYCSLII